MKMILTIINDEDSHAVLEALQQADFPVAMIDSTGGFFRMGNSTLMIGAEDERVDEAIRILDEHCLPTIEPTTRRATVFVLNVEHFEQI